MFDKTRRVSVLHRWLALIDTFLTSRYTADQSAHVTLDNKSLWSIALVITFNKLYLFSCEVANNFIEAFVFAAGSLTCKLHFSKQRRFERLLLRAFSLKAFFFFHPFSSILLVYRKGDGKLCGEPPHRKKEL